LQPNSIFSRVTKSFYRTSAGAEIDLVLELANFDIYAIEIKVV